METPKQTRNLSKNEDAPTKGRGFFEGKSRIGSGGHAAKTNTGASSPITARSIPAFSRKRWIVHLLVAVSLAGVGILGAVALTYSKPQMERKSPPVVHPLVRTSTIRIGPQTLRIFGEGTVRPVREVNLAAQVQGKVVFVSDSLVNGGRFSKEEVLVRIEPKDYELAVTAARARVKDALSRLMMAEAETEAAKEEWKTLNGGRKIPTLVAKAPQRAAAKAAYAAAKADLEKANLHLKRTRIRAPFNGRVSKKHVDIGERVSSGEVLADIFCVEEAEIVVPFSDEDLYWFHVPGFTPGDGPGAEALVRTRLTGRDMTWRGRVVHAEGKLDPQTRMVTVVIRVNDPFGRMPPLAPGVYVKVEIEGRTLNTAAIVPRSALHNNAVVWVVDDEGRIRFRNVKVARFQGDYAILESGLHAGERVVISKLKAVTDGMKVRTGNGIPTEGQIKERRDAS